VHSLMPCWLGMRSRPSLRSVHSLMPHCPGIRGGGR
jgi:hypothetical protein